MPGDEPPDIEPRAEALRAARWYKVGPIEIDMDHYFARVNDVEIRLSPIEMKLLADLANHHGRVRPRAALLTDVWGYRPGVVSRTTDCHVRRLRHKLGQAGALLETVRGVGYRLLATAADARPSASVTDLDRPQVDGGPGPAVADDADRVDGPGRPR